MLNTLVRKSRSWYGRYLATRVPRAQSPYATHLPFLVGLARILPVRHACELGCGKFSTPTFLDRAVFPELRLLESYEHDSDWMTKVEAMTGHDQRLRLQCVDIAMAEAAKRLAFSDFDVVFIDDSVTEPQRAATIAAVAAARPGRAVVLIHDYELLSYRHAARPFAHRIACSALNPAVGIVWNQAPITRHQIHLLNRFVKHWSPHIAPSDVRAWEQLFRDHFDGR